MFLRGVVTGKRVEGQDRCVDLDIWSERPDGTKTTLGAATVVLPSKASA
jgi:hypothetical protein